MNAHQRRIKARANRIKITHFALGNGPNRNGRVFAVDPASKFSFTMMTVYDPDNKPMFVGRVLEDDFTNMWMKERPNGTAFPTAIPVNMDIKLTVSPSSNTVSQVQKWIEEGKAHYEMGPDGSYVAICDGEQL